MCIYHVHSFGVHLLSDCGAGIGRVTKHLLLPLFKTVDMVEQNQEFLNAAKAYLVSQSHSWTQNLGGGALAYSARC